MAIQKDSEKLLSAVARTIKEERETKKISQSRLAADAELSNNTAINRIERQEREPALETILRIAIAMKMRPSDLLRKAEDLSGVNFND